MDPGAHSGVEGPIRLKPLSADYTDYADFKTNKGRSGGKPASSLEAFLVEALKVLAWLSKDQLGLWLL